MARVPHYRARAARRGRPGLTFDGGEAAAYAAFAAETSQLARQVGALADKAAIREGDAGGRAAALDAALPSAGLDPVRAARDRDRRSGDHLYPNSVNQSGNARRVRGFFEARGYSPEAASAIAGHLQQESGFDTGAIGDGGTAFGLAQWRLDRRTALARFARERDADMADFETQLAFMDHELSGSERRAGDALRSAATVDDATRALMHFFRPAGYTPDQPAAGHGFANRLSYAQAVLGQTVLGQAPTTPTERTPVVVPAAPLDEAAGPAFRLTGQAGTLRGDAFNRAASEIYLDGLSVRMAGEMEALAITHAGDPEALRLALDSYASGILGQVDEELRPDVQQSFERMRLAHVREATNALTRQLTAERRAAFETGLVARNSRIARIGASAGFDEAGNAAVEAELAAFDAYVAAQGDALSPVEAERFRRAAREDMAMARVTGAFDSLETLTEMRAYQEGFEQQWLGGDRALQDLGPDAYGRLTSTMEQRIANVTAERDRSARALSRQASDVVSRLEAGFPIPPAELTQLQRAAERLGDPVLSDDVRFMGQVGQWAAAAAIRPAVGVQADIAALEAQMAEHGATPRGVALLDSMRSFRDTMRQSLERDPLGWAERTGLIDVPALDLTDTESMAESLALRADTAAAVAGRYGLATPRYLRAHERQAIAEAMVSNPDTAAATATTIARALGPDGAADVLGQLAADAPGLAHAAGAVVAGGDPRAVQYVAAERALAQDPAYSPASVPAGRERAIAAEVAGASFLAAPEVEASALAAARDIFRQMARERGIAPDLAEEDGQDLYAAALQMAAGRTLGADGRAYGGFVEVNGSTTLAPAGFPADEVEQVVRGLSGAMLERLPAMMSSNGVPITARQVRRAQLVAVGDGLYRVNLARPGEPPRFVMGDAGPWTLDLREVARMQAELVPDPNDARWVMP